MLQNAYLLAKIGADAAENELNFAENLPTKIGNYPTGPLPYGPRWRRCSPGSLSATRPRSRPCRSSCPRMLTVRVSKIGKFCKMFCKFCKFRCDDFWDFRHVERSVLCRFAQQLSKEYLVANIGLNTAVL